MRYNKLISILIVSLFISLCGGIITFYDKNLMPQQVIPYSDNSVVFRLVERLNTTCNVPNLTYKILYPNGTSNLITVYDHQIPFFNFCQDDLDMIFERKILNDQISFFPTNTNYVLVIYGNLINNTGSIFGMMIDWSGKIISNTLLAENLDDTIYMDEDNQFHYVIFEKTADSNNVILKEFITSSDKGELIKLHDNLIQMPKDLYDYSTRYTVDLEILFIFVYKSKNVTLQEQSLEPEWKIYGSILQNGSNQLSDEFLIYQTSIPQLEFFGMIYDQNYDGSGFYFNFQFRNLSDTDYTLTIKVVSLSNGKIIKTEKNTDIDLNNAMFDSLALKSGGVIVVTLRDTNDGCDIFGYLLGSNSKPAAHTYVSCVDNLALITVISSGNNNTALIVQEINENYWTLLPIVIPSLKIDKGYNNPIVNQTIPAINETISVETTQIQITYDVPIKCSSQNISIYQKVDDTKDILRETFTGETDNCQVLSDYTILLTVLPSTFNKPNTSYYIKVDADFVKQSNTLEPLLGIPKNKWIFFTGSHYYNIENSVHALVRLTTDATLYFNTLSYEKKSEFSRNLVNQLAEIVPISNDRISTNNDYEIDSTASNQIIIPIKIIKSNSNSEINVSTILRTLNILIKNKPITLISKNDLTSMLDQSYGLIGHETFFGFVTIPVIVMGIILLISGICYIWANRRCQEGKNLTIIIVVLMLYDFVMDILFMYDLKTKNLMPLFWASLIFTILPILLNLSASFYIISKENSENPEFHKYFLNNQRLVSICTAISGADIEILHTLSSNFAGFNIFTAPFSEQVEKSIFWYALIGFCLEDIPQFSIQMIYRSYKAQESTISALTLISSSLMILSNIIGRSYLIIIKCKNLPPSTITDNDTISNPKNLGELEFQTENVKNA